MMFLYLITILQNMLEFLPISSSTILKLFGANFNTLNSVHILSGIVGISYFYKEILQCFQRWDRFRFYSMSALGTFIGFGIGIALIPNLRYYIVIPGAYSYLNNILQGILLYQIIDKNYNIDPEEYSIKDGLLGLLAGFMIPCSFLSGSSRMGSLLVILMIKFSLRSAFKIAVILSSVFNLGVLLLTYGEFQVFMEQNFLSSIISCIIGYGTLHLIYRYISIINYVNIFRIILYGVFLVKSLNLVGHFLEITSHIDPSYLMWVYIIIGSLLENTTCIFIGFNYASTTLHMWLLLIFVPILAFICDVATFFIIKYFFHNKIHSYLKDSIIKNAVYSKNLSFLTALLYRFVPFGRVPGLCISLLNYNNWQFIVINFVGAIIWSTALYFVHYLGIITFLWNYTKILLGI